MGLSARPGGNVAAGLLAVAIRADPASLRIQSLGGFAVLREGHVVRVSEWQSKRARELLKVLVARRGRPASRFYLMETLWPGEDPDRVSNRLSVALTTVRNVLDPEHRRPPEAFIRADKDSVHLDLSALDIDLERFLAAAGEGLGALRRGAAADAISVLEEATVAYAGDFLVENPYDDWAAPAREEARAAYIAAARALALHSVSSRDPDTAVPYFLRILEVDRYDEQAHLGLVSALADTGRHGEAHRHYLTYRRAMDELSVEPASFPRGHSDAPSGVSAAFSAP
jgi:DNA-binding SARP family transcriptional activator